jgi:membrane protease subunit HflC
MNKKSLLLALLVAAGVLLAWSCIFTVDQTEVAVVTRFGRATQPVRTAGLNFKLPWPIDGIIRVDQRRLYLDTAPQEMLTDDEKNVIVDGYLIWQIKDPIRFVETVQTRANAEARLIDLYTARMGARIGTLPFTSFVNVGSNKLEYHAIFDKVREEVEAHSDTDFGIEINAIHISGFTLPPANRASVITRMNAERSRIAARYRSEGIEQALKIEATAAAEHEAIMAKAHASATAALGKADADALKILGEAYAKDPDFYRFLRSLESYESIVGSRTTLFLETDSKLFKTLYGDKPAK